MRSVTFVVLVLLVASNVYGAEPAPPAPTVYSPGPTVAAPVAGSPPSVTPVPAASLELAPAAPPPATPYYKQPLFWTGIAVGAVLLGTAIWGIVWTTTQTPRYALVRF